MTCLNLLIKESEEKYNAYKTTESYNGYAGYEYP